MTTRAKNSTSPRTSIIQRLLANNKADTISFALGLPALDMIPAEHLSRASQCVLRTPESLQYCSVPRSLKEHLIEIMRLRSIESQPEGVFLTSGAQQALSLLMQLLVRPGSAIIADRFTYPGFLQMADLYGARIVSVPTDPTFGLDVNWVEKKVRDGLKPAFIYTITDGHNPLGGSLSAEARQKLVEVARRYRVPIVEEDVYGLLYYDSIPLPPMRAQDSEYVFYIGSLSKVLAPALRVGWLAVPSHMMSMLGILKETLDGDMATVGQQIALSFLGSGQFLPHLKSIREEYRSRRNHMLNLLQAEFPPNTSWIVPNCGAFIWVTLADNIDTAALLVRAVSEANVAFVPGVAFDSRSRPEPSTSLRLNFTHQSLDMISVGIQRLSSLIDHPIPTVAGVLSE